MKFKKHAWPEMVSEGKPLFPMSMANCKVALNKRSSYKYST